MVSENTDDMFIVKNNLDYKNVTSQDICYNEGNGLFLPKWYGSYNKTKSVILWADIDKTPSYVNIKGVSYKYFEPDIISVDMSARMTYGVLKYSTYEYESVAFTPERDLIVACNIVYTSDYVNAYKENNDGKSPGSDRIIRIRKSGGGKFTVN